MTTIRNLITGSLRLINVVQANETATEEDMNISLSALNGMIDSWSTERLSVFLLKPYYFLTVAGQKEYTLGPGGDWDITRPMQILQATLSYGGSLITTPEGVRLTSNPNVIDIPMERLTDAQYAAISVKDQPSTYPVKFYDNGDYPLRQISVWPVPTTAQPVTLWMWQPLGNSDTLDAELTFPKGYERALRFNLAVELAPEFGKEVQNEVTQTAINSKGHLKRLNSRPQIMRSDLALSSGPTIYNWSLSTTVPN